MTRSSLLLVAAALALTAPPPARAQSAAGPRVLQTWTDDVKTADDQTERWTFTVTYDPATGETARTVTDAAGRVVERTATTTAMVAPSEEERAEAERLIRADAELAAVLAASRAPVVHGGFVLLREEGHPCGPGSRCVQYDLVDVNGATRRVERLRYVVVDLRAGRVLFRDLDPATEGNLANPAADRSY